MFRTIYTFLIIGLLVIPSAFAQTEADAIQAMLEERDQEIKELLGPKGTDYTQDQRDRLKDIINDVINYQSMAEHALGDTYDEISEEEREEFVSLFSTIIRDNSLNRLDIYRAEVTYNSIEVNQDSAYVATTAQLEDVRTSVDYNLQDFNDTWMITDMTIDEVSTADSYNRQFQSIIRQRGFDALMDSLRRRASRSST
ncbi:Tgt2/MlaC family protein [Rhodohalobacter sulfatireducens]|uniref:ABC transporter substrate-binding protein n=1 Tax=Rhodohalobacter sulfatireducens TaxID=2911366 RepID=A0ABS9KI23_9BACT|nr:ABC transporter substrate-binding protein [Rhodohalobacter sulfatireducens]MCG2590502.1 ABC transporter substrate-binding protein [Rhodohalobacter sulfatireducens]MDR9365382.1 ABC transporter substrate-binding protein [Balneolaceae bacterium]MDR9410558.1 ABC transporter substrate-binding protein [Balneolaceae bacterium]